MQMGALEAMYAAIASFLGPPTKSLRRALATAPVPLGRPPPPAAAAAKAIGETVILLTLSLHPY